MKKIAIFLFIFCAFTYSALAQQAGNIQIKGVIVDNLYAEAQKPEQLAEAVKGHTKEDALKPEAVASGYAILYNGKLIKFDKISNLDIAAFLKEPKNRLQVVVACEKNKDLLRLVYIENQK